MSDVKQVRDFVVDDMGDMKEERSGTCFILKWLSGQIVQFSREVVDLGQGGVSLFVDDSEGPVKQKVEMSSRWLYGR